MAEEIEMRVKELVFLQKFKNLIYEKIIVREKHICPSPLKKESNEVIVRGLKESYFIEELKALF